MLIYGKYYPRQHRKFSVIYKYSAEVVDCFALQIYNYVMCAEERCFFSVKIKLAEEFEVCSDFTIVFLDAVVSVFKWVLFTIKLWREILLPLINTSSPEYSCQFVY